MGSPEYPTRQQLRRLEAASELHEEPLALRLDPSTGDAVFTVDLPAESVAAVHLAP
jgi:hypothetical protein